MKQTYQSEVKEYLFYIKGMRCASCELLIEKKLLSQKDVRVVDASVGSNSVRIQVKRGVHLSAHTLGDLFKEDGYSFSDSPFSDHGTAVDERRVRFRSVLKIVVLFISFLTVFFVLERLSLGQYVSVDGSSSLWLFLLLGLVAGASSCAALIGGVLLSLVKHWNEVYEARGGTGFRGAPHILFHVGRLFAFFLGGGFLGLLGGFFTFDSTTFTAVLILALSLLMIVVALQMIGVDWAERIRFRLPKHLTRIASDDRAFSGRFAPFLAGVFTLFLPCGFTLIAQGVALASGSFWRGGLVLLFFSLGTLPLLALISVAGLAFTRRPHVTLLFSRVAGLIILFFSLYNINSQLNVLGWFSLSDLNVRPEVGGEVAESLDSSLSFQQVGVIAQGFTYTSTGITTFRAGVPTKVVVDNKVIVGCGSFMYARGLFSEVVSLRPGVNIIDVGTPRPGSYKLTCSMGMVAPLILTFR